MKPYRLRFVGGPLHGHSTSSMILPHHSRTNRPEADYFLVRLRDRRGVMVEEHLCRQLTAWQEINRQIAIRIIADHAQYAVCEICGTIVPIDATVGICYRCHGYHFLFGVEEVSIAADQISNLKPGWLRHSYSL